MFTHHFKIAFRNLRKFKTQNIISIIGLSIGFTCFAFSTLWIRHEMDYDSFHSKADRIYRVHTAPFKWDTYAGDANALELRNCPYPLADLLKSNFPEIEDASAVLSLSRSIDSYDFSVLFLDYSFSKIFDLNLPEDFFIQGRTDRPVAVIPEFYTEEVKELTKEQLGWDVQMTIPRWPPANTNITFNMAVPINSNYPEQILNNWGYRIFHVYIMVHNNVDMRAFEKKLDKIEIPEFDTPLSLVLTPLKQLRYSDPSGMIQSDIKFTHIRIFAIAGLMVILCSLFNHLTLFVTRVRMRLRELALRKVHGASDWQLASTLYSDFLLVILLSLVVGFMLMALLLPIFKDYASIGVNDVSIYTELLIYAVLMIVCGFIVGSIPVLYYRKQTPNESIKGAGSPGSKNTFRKGSLLAQLVISLAMIFCAIVFTKQIRFLHNTDMGINRDNIATVHTNRFPLNTPYAEQIKQIPGVVDAIPVSRGTFTPTHFGSYTHTFTDSIGNPAVFNLFILIADNRFFDFFGVEIIHGTNFDNDTIYQSLLNETAMKLAGSAEQSWSYDSAEPGLIGVFRDFHISPTVKTKPTKIHYPRATWAVDSWFSDIAYKYEEGMREQTEKAVSQWIRNEFSSQGEFEIVFTYMEDVFEENFKSERALFKLLSVMTLACILIAVFGVYSLTSLSCEQRRKEIAVRKVHGAEVLDIMNIFFKEYLVLLAMAAIVAFPAGYLIMKRWLEGYVKQTSMDAWLYVSIFLTVFVVIVFSIFSTVWRAAYQNPAEVVKSE